MADAMTTKNFLNVLVKEIGPLVSKNIEMKDLKNSEAFVCEIINRNTPTIIIDNKFKKETVTLDKAHATFGEVLLHVRTKEAVFLTGPAGSGKSTIAEQCATALGLPFASISVCAQTTKTDFLGYKDANGRYIDTLFRKIYEGGGLYLVDEIDAGNPNVLAVLNAALSNHVFAFPDNMVKKHADFVLIATANTLGLGSTEYVGRNQLDAATLDRFNFIHVDYDPILEKALVPAKYIKTFNRFMELRSYVNKNKLPIIASTRSLIKIIKLLDIGIEVDKSLKATVFKSTNADIIKKVLSSM